MRRDRTEATAHEPIAVVKEDAIYVACKCGWGHLVGEDDFMGHVADEYERLPEAVAS